MNYYYNYPFMMPYPRPGFFGSGLFSSLFSRGINWSSLLNSTQKTLNFINQVIPVIRQVPPIYQNAKTMFRIMNEFRKIDTPTTSETTTTTTSQTTSSSNNNVQTQRQESVNPNYGNGPTFFL